MFAPANQTHFVLTIDGADSYFQVLSFTGREALNQPFEFELELVSEKASLNLESLLHKLAFLQLAQDGTTCCKRKNGTRPAACKSNCWGAATTRPRCSNASTNTTPPAN